MSEPYAHRKVVHVKNRQTEVQDPLVGPNHFPFVTTEVKVWYPPSLDGFDVAMSELDKAYWRAKYELLAKYDNKFEKEAV